MTYFVVHPGGQQYGPADLATLNMWAAEGRLIPDTTLVDAATGVHIPARDVAGLFFPIQPDALTALPPPPTGFGTPLGGFQPGQPPGSLFGANYPRPTPLSRPGGGGMPSAITASYVASAVGLALACCAPILTILGGAIGMALAASAKQLDPPRARGAMGLGVVAILVGLVFAVGMTVLGRAFSGGG